MGEFIVKRNARGVRDIMQIDERRARPQKPATPEEPQPLPKPLAQELEDELRDLQREAEDPEVAAPRAPLLDPSPAYLDIVTGLYENNGPWAVKAVHRIEDAEELARVETLEQEHPRFVGGRSTVLDAIAERRARLGSEEPARFPCTQEGCDLVFGSEGGLQSHLENIHGIAPATDL